MKGGDTNTETFVLLETQKYRESLSRKSTKNNLSVKHHNHHKNIRRDRLSSGNKILIGHIKGMKTLAVIFAGFGRYCFSEMASR